MKKQPGRIESSKTRNYKEFSTEAFEETFYDSSILGHQDFHTALAELEKELTRALVTKVEEAPIESKKEDNPLPDDTSDTALAEDFASFFLDKIVNIHTRLNTIEPYKPQPREEVPIFMKFAPVT